MPCIVKKTFEAASESGHFLIAQVKANQQNLLDTIEVISAVDHPLDASLTIAGLEQFESKNFCISMRYSKE